MRGNARIGFPHVHVRRIDSTNALARELAQAGTPHGTLVSAEQQTAGRGRQGRAWQAPAGQALICSWVIRDPRRLLSLSAGVAVAEACDAHAAAAAGATQPVITIKWPNDVLIEGRKVAGILVEGRPRERWAVLGVGINAAVKLAALPAELRARAGTLALPPDRLGPLRAQLCELLGWWLEAQDAQVLAALRERDALRGQRVSWESAAGMLAGTADGVDDRGRLRVCLDGGHSMSLDAGDVHLLDRR